MTTAPVAFTPPPTTNGQFGMTAVSTGPDTFLIGGPLQTNSSGSASGTFRIDSSTSTCFDFFTPLAFNGTITSQGLLSLTSAVFQSQTITVSGTLSSDGKMLSGGTFSINGGCGTGIHGTLTGFQLPLVNGTYTGSFTAGGSNIGISLMLSQPNTPNNFGVSGSATFTNGGACTLSSANILASETGFIAGVDVRAGMLDSSVTMIASLRGAFTDGTAKMIKGTLSIPAGPCTGTSVPITLTMP